MLRSDGNDEQRNRTRLDLFHAVRTSPKMMSGVYKRRRLSICVFIMALGRAAALSLQSSQKEGISKSSMAKRTPNHHDATGVQSNADEETSIRRLQWKQKCNKKSKTTCSPTATLPSRIPVEQPSNSPTAVKRPPSTVTPSPAPTISSRPSDHPSLDLDRFETTFENRNGVAEIVSACRNDEIPENAFDQVIRYNYVMNILSGANPALAVDEIESQMHRELSTILLDDCLFRNETNPFHTYSLSTYPSDNKFSMDCDDVDVIENSICYIVETSFTASLFFPTDRLLLSDRVEYSAIFEEFSAILYDVFSWGNFLPATVVNASFINITNFGPSPAPSPNSSAPGETADKIVDAANNNNTPARKWIGVTLIVGIPMALVAASLFMLLRKRQKKDSDGSVQRRHRATRIPGMYNDAQSGEHDDIPIREAVSRYIIESHEISNTIEATEIRSDDLSQEMPVKNKETSIEIRFVDDDESFVTGLGSNFMLHEYDSRQSIPQNPTFISVDDIITTEDRARMLASIRKDFGTEVVQANRGRQFLSCGDTVDL